MFGKELLIYEQIKRSFMSSWWPCALASSQKMKMKMHDQLASLFTVVDYQSVTIFKFLLLGNLGSSQNQFPQNCFVLFFSVFNHVESILYFWNDENVNWGLRCDVSKSQNLIIFVNNIGWNLLSDDFIKDRFSTHLIFLKDIL